MGIVNVVPLPAFDQLVEQLRVHQVGLVRRGQEPDLFFGELAVHIVVGAAPVEAAQAVIAAVSGPVGPPAAVLERIALDVDIAVETGIHPLDIMALDEARIEGRVVRGDVLRIIIAVVNLLHMRAVVRQVLLRDEVEDGLGDVVFPVSRSGRTFVTALAGGQRQAGAEQHGQGEEAEFFHYKLFRIISDGSPPGR